MSFYDILSKFMDECGTGSTLFIILIVILTLIQVTPIKINPWSALGSAIGKSLNKEVMKEITSVKTDIGNLKSEIETVKSDVEKSKISSEEINKKIESLDFKVEENNIIVCRNRILRFGDEVSHGTNHSREHFTQIMEDITAYNAYCENHSTFKNEMTILTTERIKSDYAERDQNNDFL